MNTAKNYIGSNDINLHVHQFHHFIEKKNSNNQLKKIDFLIMYCKLMTAAASNLQRISRMLRKQLKFACASVSSVYREKRLEQSIKENRFLNYIL